MTNPAIHTEGDAEGFGGTIARIIMAAMLGVTAFVSLAMFAG